MFRTHPLLAAYFFFLAGYALFWPSWLGLVWLGPYGLIAHLMVLTEEGHLRRVFGREYEDYSGRTPRYLGVPRKGAWGATHERTQCNALMRSVAPILTIQQFGTCHPCGTHGHPSYSPRGSLRQTAQRVSNGRRHFSVKLRRFASGVP